MPKCKSIKRLIPASMAWCILLGTTFLFFYFPCRKLLEDYHFSLAIAQMFITFFVITNFFCTTFFDPGIIKRANSDEDKDDFRAPLYKEVQVKNQTVRMKWCSTCQFYRPPRCSHCSVCDYCIETFDHHCPWVNNCIGRRNYRHFFFFLIFLSIDMFTTFTWCMILVNGKETNLNDIESIVSIGLMVLILLLLIPVYGLTGFHIVLVARGRTTNEQVTHKFKNASNPFSQGLFYNCLYTLCGPRYPGLHISNKTDVEEFLNTDNALKVYNDNIPLDVQNRNIDVSYKHSSGQSDNTDIVLQRLDNQSSSLRSDAHFRQPSQSKLHHEEYHSSPEDSLGNVYSAGGETKTTMERHIVTMQHSENGTKETTFIALPSSNVSKSPLDRSSGMFSYFNDKISVTPSKSTSINELSTHLKKSPTKKQFGHPNNDGGMVIFYSPDAGCISSNKFNSETELQRYKSSSPTTTVVTSDYSPTSVGYNSELRFEKSNESIARRPMPFFKALEMANKIETGKGRAGAGKKEKDENVRQGHYEMNYEISV